MDAVIIHLAGYVALNGPPDAREHGRRICAAVAAASGAGPPGMVGSRAGDAGASGGGGGWWWFWSWWFWAWWFWGWSFLIVVVVAPASSAGLDGANGGT